MSKREILFCSTTRDQSLDATGCKYVGQFSALLMSRMWACRI